MPLKATLLFQDTTGIPTVGFGNIRHVGGWSESVYYFSDDIAALRTVLYNDGVWGTALCKSRAALLPATASIVGQRVANVFPRTGRSQTSKNPFPGASDLETDIPQMALNCTIRALNTSNTRHFQLRGIPDVFVKDGEFSAPNFYLAALAAYFTSLGNFHFPGKILTNPVFNLVGIDATGIATFTAPPGWPLDSNVEIKTTVNATGKKIKLKRFVVAAGPGVNQVTFGNWGDGATTGGTGQRIEVGLFNMDPNSGTVDRVTTRKVGRPFDQYRGRRSKKTLK